MNTKKQIALPIVVVIAVLLAFSNSAVADYSGDKPLTTYEHGMVKNGGIVFGTVVDGSAYTALNATETCPRCGMDILSQQITISIPAGATVEMARLYNYNTWSTSDNDNTSVRGVPAEAVLTFSDGTNTWTKTCVHGFNDSQIDSVPNPIYYGDDAVQYWDSKGQGYTSKKYDYPSGTFALDVTDMVTGSGTFTATIENADSTPTGFRPGHSYPSSNKRERFATYGFGLLVVYGYPTGPVDVEYWIDEGRDLLYNSSYYGVTAEEATTYAPFNGVVNWGVGLKDATLTTVLTASDKGTNVPPENMVSFNGVEKGPSTAANDKAIAKDPFNVTSELEHADNFADFQDRGDYEGVCNAFLVVEKP